MNSNFDDASQTLSEFGAYPSESVTSDSAYPSTCFTSEGAYLSTSATLTPEETSFPINVHPAAAGPGSQKKGAGTDKGGEEKQRRTRQTSASSNKKNPKKTPKKKKDKVKDRVREKVKDKVKKNAPPKPGLTLPPFFFMSDKSFEEAQMIKSLARDIIEVNPNVHWNDIAALEDAKRTLQEAIILPLMRPDFFKGIRRPWKGVLMVGPPGTGKTMLAKAVATESKTTFFNVTAASLLAKYFGDSEKLVRVLFKLAKTYAPSTIFFDEICAICSKRGGTTEHEASRRLKSELLVQMDGVCTDLAPTEDDDLFCTQAAYPQTSNPTPTSNSLQEQTPGNRHMVIIAASNHPWDIDEALRRRLEKRIYVPLPDIRAREELLRLNLKDLKVNQDVDVPALAGLMEGYSAADITVVCRDASFMAMRRRMAQAKSLSEMKHIDLSEIDKPISDEDFRHAISNVSKSVSSHENGLYENWMSEFGSR